MTARLSPTIGIAFAMLERAANAGAPCPSNAEIAAAINVFSNSTASNIVTDLEKRGLILVERGGMSRVVTIVATGKRTAGQIRAQHWRHRTEGFVPKPRVSSTRPVAPTRAVARLIVARDPCPRCGTRGDLDCGHSGAALFTVLTSPPRQGLPHSEGAG